MMVLIIRYPRKNAFGKCCIRYSLSGASLRGRTLTGGPVDVVRNVVLYRPILTTWLNNGGKLAHNCREVIRRLFP